MKGVVKTDYRDGQNGYIDEIFEDAREHIGSRIEELFRQTGNVDAQSLQSIRSRVEFGDEMEFDIPAYNEDEFE